jgi:hypothetical protein
MARKYLSGGKKARKYLSGGKKGAEISKRRKKARKYFSGRKRARCVPNPWVSLRRDQLIPVNQKAGWKPGAGKKPESVP